MLFGTIYLFCNVISLCTITICSSALRCTVLFCSVLYCKIDALLVLRSAVDIIVHPSFFSHFLSSPCPSYPLLSSLTPSLSFSSLTWSLHSSISLLKRLPHINFTNIPNLTNELHLNDWLNSSSSPSSLLFPFSSSFYFPLGGLDEGRAEIYFPSYVLRFMFGAFLCLFSFSYSFSVGLICWVLPAELFPFR